MVAKKLEGNFRGFPFLPQCMYIIGNENNAYIGPRLQQIACSGAIYAMERTVSEILIVMKTALTSI